MWMGILYFVFYYIKGPVYCTFVRTLYGITSSWWVKPMVVLIIMMYTLGAWENVSSGNKQWAVLTNLPCVMPLYHEELTSAAMPAPGMQLPLEITLLWLLPYGSANHHWNWAPFHEIKGWSFLRIRNNFRRSGSTVSLVGLIHFSFWIVNSLKILNR